MTQYARNSRRPFGGFVWYFFSLCSLCLCGSQLFAADVESRQLTHYVPQDFLEIVVRKGEWVEVTLDVKGGVRKGDIVRIWAGGSIDRGDGERPGQVVNGPEGIFDNLDSAVPPTCALSPKMEHAYALLFKTDSADPMRCLRQGRPLEIKVARDKEKLWIGFNDEKGRFQDNHLGKGLRHELDPLWVRIEVVRMTVD
jgi:hypothetical protein